MIIDSLRRLVSLLSLMRETQESATKKNRSSMVLCTIKLDGTWDGLDTQIGFASMRTYGNVPTCSYYNSFSNCDLHFNVQK